MPLWMDFISQKAFVLNLLLSPFNFLYLLVNSYCKITTTPVLFQIPGTALHETPRFGYEMPFFRYFLYFALQ